jgi:sn-glycerol 3-phosphate transport system substrate-binding protein
VKTRRRFLQDGAAALATLSGACDAPSAAAGRSVASLWFTYGGRNRQVLELLVDKFNRSGQRHFVRAIFQGDYFEGLAKLRTGIAASAGPTFSHVIGEVVPYLERAGVLEPLDAYPGARELGVVPELGQAGSWVGGAERPSTARRRLPISMPSCSTGPGSPHRAAGRSCVRLLGS